MPRTMLAVPIGSMGDEMARLLFGRTVVPWDDVTGHIGSYEFVNEGNCR